LQSGTTAITPAAPGRKSAIPDRLSSATFSHRTGHSASNRQPARITGHRLPGGPPTNDRALKASRSTNNADLTQNRTDLANSPATGQSATGLPKTTGQPGPDGLPYIWIDPERVHIGGNYQLNVDVKAPPAATVPKQQASPKVRSSFLYAGVIVAPDASMVKMQSVKGVGSTFGILLGYAFNKHWAVETGAYLDRKKYYTTGEYFNTSKVHLPPNSTLLNVNGTCNMWEIPLNVRHNFNPEGRLRWFATAGLSTYLMTGEKYTYAYQQAGSYWGSDSTWNIKRPSQYPFAIVNLSVGLEQRIGKIGSLRIEPYARLPLTGMGTGKLPIMSTGVNIGFVRPLWK
jgi:hypothetical protein